MIKSILMNSLAIADRHMNFAVTGFKMLTLSTSLLLHPHTGNGRPFAGPASTHTHMHYLTVIIPNIQAKYNGKNGASRSSSIPLLVLFA